MTDIERFNWLYGIEPKPEPPAWIMLAVAGIVAIILLWAVGNARAETPERLRTIAMVIAAEAGGEGARGLRAVANTIANRARTQHKTPYQIVTAKHQYYGLTSKNRLKLYNQNKAYCDYLAKNIMTIPDITSGAQFFRTAQERLFPWCKNFTVKINNHLFYRG